MTWDKCFELFRNTTYICFYPICFAIGSVLICYFDMEKIWQQKRVKAGLTDENDKVVPRFKFHLKKEAYENRILNTCRIRLWLFSATYSLIIVTGFYLTNITRSINTFADFLTALIQVLIYYGAFINTTGDTSNGEEIKKISAMLNGFKDRSADLTVSIERRYYENEVKDLIGKWFSEWILGYDTKFGVLVLRIKENYLLKLLPNDIPGIKEEYMDLKIDIVQSFLDETSTISDEIIEFLLEKSPEMNVKMYKIVTFTKNVTIVSRKYDNKEAVIAEIGSGPKTMIMPEAEHMEDLPALDICNEPLSLGFFIKEFD